MNYQGGVKTVTKVYDRPTDKLQIHTLMEDGTTIISTPADALFNHVIRVLQVWDSVSYLATLSGISRSSLSRIRSKTSPVPDEWIIKAHYLSGISVHELRMACCLPELFRHPLALAF